MQSDYNKLLEDIEKATDPTITENKVFIDPIRDSEVSRIVKKLLDRYVKLKEESEQTDFSDISDLIDDLDKVKIEQLLINTKIKQDETH
jgi:hypothetical protein